MTSYSHGLPVSSNLSGKKEEAAQKQNEGQCGHFSMMWWSPAGVGKLW